MLLTSLPVDGSFKSQWRVVEGCLSRWRIEEMIRFARQAYGFENIRVTAYSRIRDMASLVLASAYFATVWIGRNIRREVLAERLRVSARGWARCRSSRPTPSRTGSRGRSRASGSGCARRRRASPRQPNPRRLRCSQASRSSSTWTTDDGFGRETPRTTSRNALRPLFTRVRRTSAPKKWVNSRSYSSAGEKSAAALPTFMPRSLSSADGGNIAARLPFGNETGGEADVGGCSHARGGLKS